MHILYIFIAHLLFEGIFFAFVFLFLFVGKLLYVGRRVEVRDLRSIMNG